MLKGSAIRESAQDYDIKYTDYAPYEVLSTHAISYEELRKLHRIEHLTDALYNSGHFRKTLEHIVPFFSSPFVFYEKLAEFLKKNGYFTRPHKKQILFNMLYQFMNENHAVDFRTIKEALIFDWLCLEKPRSWPKHIELVQTDSEKQQIRSFLKDKDNIKKYLPAYLSLSSGEISKRCVIYTFKSIMQTAVLFDYGQDKSNRNFYQYIEMSC